LGSVATSELLQAVLLKRLGVFSQPFSFALPMAKEKPQQAWKVHPTRKHLPAVGVQQNLTSVKLASQ